MYPIGWVAVAADEHNSLARIVRVSPPILISAKSRLSVQEGILMFRLRTKTAGERLTTLSVFLRHRRSYIQSAASSERSVTGPNRKLRYTYNETCTKDSAGQFLGSPKEFR